MSDAPTHADQDAELREALIAFFDQRYWGKTATPSKDADDLIAGPLAALRARATAAEAERDRLTAQLRESAMDHIARDLTDEGNFDRLRAAEAERGAFRDKLAEMCGKLMVAEADSSALRARIGELESALKPFAKALSENGIRGADLRAARSALSHPISTTQTEEAGNG